MVAVAQLMVKVGADGVEQTEQQLKSLGFEVENTQSKMNNMGSGTHSLVGGLLDFGSKVGMTIFGIKNLADTAISLGGALLAPNASLEQTRVSFMAFLNDGQKVDSLLKNLKTFAATTPFEFPEVQQASLKLLNMGVSAQNVTKYLGDIGAAVSKVGGTGADLNDVTVVLSQMYNTGHIALQDMYQLTNRNIPAFKLLADGMHIPVSQLMEMISQGTLGKDKIALLVQELGKFGGSAMVEQGKTFNGLLSTVKDNATQALAAFTGPLFDMAKQGLTQLGNLVSSPAFQQFATGAGQQVANVFKFIGDAGQYVWNVLRSINLTPLTTAWNNLKVAVAPIGDLFKHLGSIFSAVGTDADPIAEVIQKIAGAGLGTITNLIQGLANALNGLSKNSAVQGFLSSLVQGFHQVSSIVGGQFSQNFKMVQGILADLGRWWQSTMQPAIQQAMPAFQRLGSIMATVVAPAIAKVWAVGQELMRQVMPPLIKAFETIAPIVMKVAGIVADNLGKAIQFLTPYIVQATQTIGKFASEIISRVIPIVQQIWSQIKAGLDFILPLWNAVWPSIQQIFKGVWEAIKGTVQMIWAIVSGIIKTGLDLVRGDWRGVWNDIKGIFQGVWDGIKSIAQGTWDAIGGIIRGGINLVIGLINNFLGGLNSIHLDLGPIHIPSPNIPLIPLLASGGDVQQGGMAIVGERGPESVWLPAGARVTPLPRGGTGSPVIHVHVHTDTVIDGQRLAGVMWPHLVNSVRHTTGSWGY